MASIVLSDSEFRSLFRLANILAKNRTLTVAENAEYGKVLDGILRREVADVIAKSKISTGTADYRGFVEYSGFESSNINRVWYRHSTATLRIMFVNGRAYDYKNVPFQKVMDMLNAPSVGGFFNTYIKHQFQTIFPDV